MTSVLTAACPVCVNRTQATPPTTKAATTSPIGDSSNPMPAPMAPSSDDASPRAAPIADTTDSTPLIARPAPIKPAPMATIAPPTTVSTAPTLAAMIMRFRFSVINFRTPETTCKKPDSTSATIGAIDDPISKIVAPITRRTRLMASVICAAAATCSGDGAMPRSLASSRSSRMFSSIGNSSRPPWPNTAIAAAAFWVGSSIAPIRSAIN